jgi:hypothetical protein
MRSSLAELHHQIDECTVCSAFVCPYISLSQVWTGAVGTKYSSGQHDFDFHLGTWKTHNLLLAHPLSGSTTWIEFNGTVTVQKILDGRK